jgi:hypothetical protein
VTAVAEQYNTSKCRKEELMEIDIGDLCTHCGRNTAWNSGDGPPLFVNRIPSDADGTLILAGGKDLEIGEGLTVDIPVTVEGYMCVDCQMIECDRCGEMVLDYDIVDGDIVCSKSKCRKEESNA